MSLESSKTLGGVGAILIAVGSFVPFLALVGIILVLIAMKGLSEYFSERGIFLNVLYGFIFSMIGIVVTIVLLVAALFAGTFTAMRPFSATTVFQDVLGGAFLAGVIVSIFSLLQAFLYRKSFTILSEMSGEKRFDTAGLLLLIGAILAIIITGLMWLLVTFQGFEALLRFFFVSWIGGIFPLVAWILAAVGFSSIKMPTTQLPAEAPTPTVSVEKKFCRYCGAKNETDAIFCEKCGREISEKANS
ncbi:MAG: DUF996 domain-containing protein [Candidatus Bathyarchaeota archaeon]|jgi:uncharacterized membrane protein